MDLSDAELERAKETLTALGFKVISIASPLLKCVLPNSPAVDDRFQQDVFAATRPVYNAAIASGHAMEDTAAVCAVLERQAGVKRGKKGAKRGS